MFSAALEVHFDLFEIDLIEHDSIATNENSESALEGNNTCRLHFKYISSVLQVHLRSLV